MIKKMRENEKRQQVLNMRSTMPMGIVKPNIQIEQAVARAAETKIVSHRPEDDSSSKKKRYLYDGVERKHPSPSPEMAGRANDPAQTSTFSLGYHTLGAGSLKSSNVVKQGPSAALSFGQKFPKQNDMTKTAFPIPQAIKKGTDPYARRNGKHKSNSKQQSTSVQKQIENLYELQAAA